MTDIEVLEFLESKPHKLIVMSGPTKCGKTKTVKSIRSDRKHIITSEGFSDFGFMLKRRHTVPEINNIMMTAYQSFDYLVIEDIDMTGGALMLIECYVEDFISEYIDRSTLILTGVDIFRWKVFWNMYYKNEVIFVTFCEGEDKIEKW